MRRLTALAGTAVWQVFGAGHSVARVLKERGKLAQSVRAMRDEAPDGVIGNLLGPKAKRLVPDVPQMTGNGWVSPRGSSFAMARNAPTW